ncbi:hypothetical protein AGABI1DRAFT_114245 [Agaricus bisporus var. burnettii JB137-S8]|uniref:Uncharacterized protein n=1 Tax=Agaricus bisporus var. burnettii (strain JB137-S8 / ATCC MYA-4627 / FGSC 10392) TaxID=597362 RepID=K5X634_AGABU|nr:uncharacterized protein AGABI1DRAFT_114245 [Agaricus bisporus var. burnettii JB137-S8]EKM78628.1 hypothetical protein AGABI1DRAFT_114245 [Agaricus bisporus var. burnettii JB137-S8]
MAASLPVIAESGIRTNFGSLFLQRRAVVVFIRHFWCPLCQDYMTSVTSLNRSELLFGSVEKDLLNEKTWGTVNDNDKEGKVGGPSKLIVIGNGSYTMIGKYKQIFGAGAAGLEVYTDPSLAVYNALGMGKDPASLSDHTRPFNHREGKLRKGRGSPPQARLDFETLSGDIGRKDVSDGTRGSTSKDCSSGGYVKHGLMGGIAMVFVRALKVGMPVWEKGGDLHQLGGEFVFGPGLTCAYAHRMQHTKGHAPFEDALRAAGIIIPPPSVRPLLQAKTREARTRVLEKKGDPRSSKSQNPSIGGNRSTAPKLRARGQTIGVMPISAPIADIPASIPASLSTPILSSEPSQARMRTSRERRKSLRDRKKSVHLLTDEVPMGISGPGFRPNGKQTLTDYERESNLSVPIHTPTPLSEPDWTENRHRSLQTIKERKNARRGLGSTEERQVISGSISISKSRSHSRPLSPTGPISSSCPVSQANQIRQYREQSKSRLDYESGMGPDGVGVASDWKPIKGRGGKGSVDVEHVVQSDTGGISVQMKGRRGDDVAREMKVNLSRDRLVQREWEEYKEREVDHILTGYASEEDVKTVSDKTLVHQ